MATIPMKVNAHTSMYLIAFIFIPMINAYSCGYSTTVPPTGRIINGTEVPPGSYPWVKKHSCEGRVRMRIRIFFQIVSIQHPLVGHSCGGSLIDANHVISAAHCFFSVFFYSSIIHIGSQYLTDKIVLRTIAEVTIHPSYVLGDGNPYDIVLLRLNQSVDTSIYLPICMSTAQTSQLELPGEDVIVAGWGLTEAGGQSNALLQTRLKIHDPSIPECQPFISDVEKQLCVGVQGGGTGSCTVTRIVHCVPLSAE